jgi:hypothetical protein
MSQLALPLENLSGRHPAVLSDRANRRLLALLQAALTCAALVVLASYAVVALAHLHDRYGLNHVSGAYTALAMLLNQGTFYPELHDGTLFGGTRYMPLGFVLHAGMARLTGEYLVSGKVLTYGLTMVLLVQLFGILRGLGCNRRMALALISLVLLNDPGWLACTTIRGDLLAVVLQLAAILVVRGELTMPRLLMAAWLCTLAMLTKTTAMWAPLAIVCCHFTRQRRQALLFLPACAGMYALELLAVNWCSAGRFFLNLRALSAASVDMQAMLLGPLFLLWRLGRGGVLLGMLIPLVVVEIGRVVTQRRLSVWHWSFCFCVLLTVGIFFDKGVYYNHLLDLVVLAIPLLGSLWAALPSAGHVQSSLRTVFALVLGWVMFMGWNTTILVPLAEARAAGYPARPLAELIGDDDPLLCEDPWVAIARNRLPCVLDPYSLARLADTRPDIPAALAERIGKHEFAWIVLCQDVNDSNVLDRQPWEERHFGRVVVGAMREHYRLQQHGRGWWVYVPR